MKTSFRSAILLICAILWICCTVPDALAGGPEKAESGSAAAIKKGLNDTGQAICNFTMARKRELMAKIHSSLKALDRQIQTFEAHSKKESGKMDRAAREKSQRALKALKRRRAEVGTWLDRLQKSSSQTWNRAKKGLADRWRSLEKAFDDAAPKVHRGSPLHSDAGRSC
jgi:chromosome segregation ATPase